MGASARRSQKCLSAYSAFVTEGTKWSSPLLRYLKWLEAERREAVVMNPDFDEIPTHPAKKKLNAEQIMDLTQKFKPVTNPRCALQSDFGSLVSRVALEGFSDDEILKIVRAFKKSWKEVLLKCRRLLEIEPHKKSLFFIDVTGYSIIWTRYSRVRAKPYYLPSSLHQ
ncbi:hypothetical protein KIN20_000257 [Parelaphostrongylus tenuis]|uniref:Uncharacterized protein n=1 Tax=Parelaphostrongylus tenuis TaxID=148309 RepID=A0AAD5MAY7_PARTN|nr:hypothetical protein KIN20_000257 [Parelaphostrongylus tenuis]